MAHETSLKWNQKAIIGATSSNAYRAVYACVCVYGHVNMHGCVYLQMYAIDDCELVRSYMTRSGASCKGLHRYLSAISPLCCTIRMRTFVESKRPNSAHILGETPLSFCLCLVIARRYLQGYFPLSPTDYSTILANLHIHRFDRA